MKDPHWNRFYATEDKALLSPSSFALLVRNSLNKDSVVLELGCGNGRDSLFLKDYCKQLFAIDSSESAIDLLLPRTTGKIVFIHLDVASLNKLEITPTDVYSRFFHHSIDRETESVLFNWLKSLPIGTNFYLECRSAQDALLDKHFGNNHYRRPVNYLELVDNLRGCGFDIIDSTESRGLAVYKEEDPWVIRIIARKK